MLFYTVADTRNDTDVEIPNTIVAHKILNFALNSQDLSRKYIEFVFDTPAELQANTKYWVGFSKYGGVTFIYLFHSRHSNQNRLAVHSQPNFRNGTDLPLVWPTLDANGNYPGGYQQNADQIFWFRLFNPNAAVGKGEKGDPGPQGQPRQDG